MAIRIYILPMVIANIGPITSRQPKYVVGKGYNISSIPYGAENICICACVDIPQVDHDALILNADVMSLPTNLDTLMSATAILKSKGLLDSLNLPSNWIDAAKTYREVAKRSIGLLQLAQRWIGITGGSSLFNEGLNLDSNYDLMDSTSKARMNSCFDSLNVDRNLLNSTSTIRYTLNLFATEFIKREIKIGGVIL